MLRRFLLAYLVIGLLTISGLAQAIMGRLVGTVSDANGVIPGATVTVNNNDSGKKIGLVSGGNGSFSLPQLDVGTYTVTVSVPNFKTFTATNVKIEVGKEYSLNIKLAVGNISDEVTVVAGVDLLNATTAELSNTVTPEQIRALPLNGRNPLELISLQAGSANTGAYPTTINGQRSSFTNITRDGINIQDNFIRSNATTFVPDQPTIDNTGEFTVTTQNAGADQGSGASQVSLVTPRGTNEFHGSLFEYNRNGAAEANSFFNNFVGSPVPFRNRNQFGGRIGGPIIKEKLFFFGYYEGLRDRRSSLRERTILLQDARSGIFTYRDNSGQVRTLNVLSTAGFSGIDPIVNSRVLSGLPTGGNRSDLGDQLNTTGLSFNQKNNSNRNNFTTSIDYDLRAAHAIRGVFSYADEENLRPDADGSAGFSTTPVIIQPAKRKFLSLSYRATPSAHLTNTVSGGFLRSRATFDRTQAPPAYYISVPLISSPEVSFQPQGRSTFTYSLRDDAVYQWGTHSFRFGTQTQFVRINSFVSFNIVPTFSLGTNQNTPSLTAAQFPGGISSVQLGRANNLLALLGGIVGAGDQRFNVTSKETGFVPGAFQINRLNYDNYSFYFQDQWRATPRLTLGAGLRYEIYTPVRDASGLALEPVIPAGTSPIAAILNPNGTYNFVGGNAGGTNFYKTDKNNFAPILYAAYSPKFENAFLNHLFPGDGKTVIRGGFRMSYVNDELVRSADNALSGNQGLSQSINALTPGGSPNVNLRLNNLPTLTTPTLQVPRTYLQNNLIAGRFGTVFAIDPNLQAARTVEYNFSIQRELGWQTAIEARYVGSFSNNLVRGNDYNQVEVRDNGFVADFTRARQNLILSGGRSGAYDPNIPGSQPLTVFPNLSSGGLLNNPTIINQLQAGTAADLAILYIQNNLAGNVRFLANPNTGVADLLNNSSKYRYNALQLELRRRFSQGLAIQANYTFQKTLTDSGGTGQTRFDPVLDNRQPKLEYARAEFDQAHIFNANFIYDLPFGKGQRYFNDPSPLHYILGGFQLSSIYRIGSGAPLSIVAPTGTLNRAGRAGRQTPFTSLTKDQIKNLLSVRRITTGTGGVYYIDPNILGADRRGAVPCGQTPFSGEVFFNPCEGQTGNLERFFLSGPVTFNWDAGLTRTIPITERVKVNIRAEAFNLINRANFFFTSGATLQSVNSTTFGRISSASAGRIMQFSARLDF
ncbi:MAG: TonB-dependent receptor [Acidobacteria bacterium]|nr:TonB-dependent receptor [Acidobacteriota bacterium]